jgi:Tol biopolymer transport system component
VQVRSVGADGVELVHPFVYVSDPDWSRDGRRIVYIEAATGELSSSTILTIRPNGKGARLVAEDDSDPDW